MGAQGQTTVNFGAFPGVSDTSVAVPSTGILAGSLVEAWVPAVLTGDHSADEHFVDPPYVTAGNIVAGTGFTIYARTQGGAPQLPTADIKNNYQRISGPVTGAQFTLPNRPQPMPRSYGLWTVAWVWN